MRITGLVGVIALGALSASAGIAQQQLGRSFEDVDCEYRVQLIRDRVVALTERSPQQSLRDPQDDVVSTLIRETHDACATEDAQLQKLERIGELFDTLQRIRAQGDETHRELLAL